MRRPHSAGNEPAVTPRPVTPAEPADAPTARIRRSVVAAVAIAARPVDPHPRRRVTRHKAG